MESAFADAWGTKTPIAWANTNFVPPTAQPWVSVDVQPRETVQVTIGTTAVMRERGRFRVEIYVPAGTGTKKAEELADDVAEAIQRQHLVNDVILFSTTRLPGAQVGAGWWMMPTETVYMASFVDTL